MDSEKSVSIAGRLLTPGCFFTDVHGVALIVERKNTLPTCQYPHPLFLALSINFS